MGWSLATPSPVPLRLLGGTPQCSTHKPAPSYCWGSHLPLNTTAPSLPPTVREMDQWHPWSLLLRRIASFSFQFVDVGACLYIVETIHITFLQLLMLHHRVSCFNMIDALLRSYYFPGSLLLQFNRMEWSLDMTLSALPAVAVVNFWMAWAMVPSMLQWGCSLQPLSTAALSLHPPVQGQDLGPQCPLLAFVIGYLNIPQASFSCINSCTTPCCSCSYV